MTENLPGVAVLLTGFLGPKELTEVREKIGYGNRKPWPAWHPAEFPITLRKLRASTMKFEWIRLIYLSSKNGEMRRNDDPPPQNAGIEAGQITRLYVPILTGDGVTFHSWDRDQRESEKRFPTGALCYLDHRRMYGVRNRDPRLTAVHLVLDVLGSDQLRQLIHAACEPGAQVAAAR